MARTRVLIIDDGRMTVRPIRDALEDAGWQTYVANGASEAIRIIKAGLADLAILRLSPHNSGVDFCHMIRKASQIPVVVISSKSGQDGHDEEVMWLDKCADDYVSKPFSPAQLLARIRAVLRRARTTILASNEPHFKGRDLAIDFDSRRVFIRGQECRLTPTEYSLLKELAANAGRTLTYEHLLAKVWGDNSGTDRKNVHTYIKRVRKKIETDASAPEHVLAVPGIGYLLTEEPL